MVGKGAECKLALLASAAAVVCVIAPVAVPSAAAADQCEISESQHFEVCCEGAKCGLALLASAAAIVCVLAPAAVQSAAAADQCETPNPNTLRFPR